MSEPRGRPHFGAGAVITTLACILLTMICPALLWVAGTSMELARRLGERAEQHPLLTAALFTAPAALYFVLCLWLVLRTRRLPTGYPGRARLMGLGISGALYGLLGGGDGPLGHGACQLVPEFADLLQRDTVRGVLDRLHPHDRVGQFRPL